MNIIVLPLIALANPVTPTGAPDARTIWAYWIPRVVHDVTSFWSIVFWLWASVQAADAASSIIGPMLHTAVTTAAAQRAPSIRLFEVYDPKA